MDREQFIKKTEAVAVIQFDAEEALKYSLLDPSVVVDKPPTIITINGHSCMTACSFSVVIGRAKARKGFLIGSITAAAASGRCSIDGIRGEFVNGKTGVIYFDTEQGSYWGQIAHKRILKAIGQDLPNNMQYYDLQQFTPDQRLQMIETAISGRDDLSMVVIDGVRDLISSINDEGQATIMTSHILRWCATKKLHVVCILHTNKNDYNARGHIGTELINKAETVISVTKDKDDTISSVKQDFCRDKEFRPFSFLINDEGLPVLADTPQPEKPALLHQKSVFEAILPPPRIVTRGVLVAEYMERTGNKTRTAQNHINSGIENRILAYDEKAKGYKLFQLWGDEEPF